MAKLFQKYFDNLRKSCNFAGIKSVKGYGYEKSTISFYVCCASMRL